MEYIEVYFKLEPLSPAREILCVELGEKGFEAFEDVEDGVKAFIKENEYVDDLLESLFVKTFQNQKIDIILTKIKNENWNAIWESNFAPIVINSNCTIRAPFHSSPDVKYDVVISPQMSFGTGHHETTFLMAKELFALQLSNMNVLDMGSGTGVLAIIAEKLGANSIRAIDIEEGAYLNAIDNCKLNNIQKVIVEKGDAKLLSNSLFHLILANINKNILLEDISIYSRCLVSGGKLLLSGFFTTDVEQLKKEGLINGLKFVKIEEKNNWALLMLEKQ